MDKIKLVGKKGLIGLVITALIAAGAGFWAGYDYKTAEIRNSIAKAFGDSEDDITAQRAEAEPLKDLEIVEVKQGEVMKFATIDVEFISAESKDIINVPYGTPFVADEGTKFVIVRHKVTNTTKGEFPYEVLPILDDEDRIYNRDTDVYGLDDDMAYDTLSPNVPKTGVSVYRVPVGTKNFTLGSTKAGADQFIGTKFTIN